MKVNINYYLIIKIKNTIFTLNISICSSWESDFFCPGAAIFDIIASNYLIISLVIIDVKLSLNVIK
jgi:hypothetical protein